jgi:hypothetical protein
MSCDGVDAPRRHLRAKVEALTDHLKEASVGQASTIGLDIAKHIFPALCSSRHHPVIRV